jgi:hypothetical protein
VRAGRQPPTQIESGVPLAYLCNAFLDSRLALQKSGDFTQRSFNDYKATCKRLLEQFGRNIRVSLPM